MPAEWIQFSAADLFPQEMADALSTIGSTADTLSSVLDLAADVVDIAALFVSGLADLNAALIAATKALIDSLVQQLLGTGVYMLEYISPSPGIDTNPFAWLTAVSRSFDDPYDANKPILVDPSGYVGALVLVQTGPSFKDLMALFEKLAALFEALTYVGDDLFKLKEPGDTPPAFIPGTAEEPNWKSLTVAKLVPPIGLIAEQLKAFGDTITSALSAGDIYSAFADILRSKADILRDVADTIQQALDTLLALLDATGFILPIYGQGDKTFVQRALLTSTGGPLSISPALATYTAGFMFLAQGGTTGPADVLFDLFGVAKTVTVLPDV